MNNLSEEEYSDGEGPRAGATGIAASDYIEEDFVPHIPTKRSAELLLASPKIKKIKTTENSKIRLKTKVIPKTDKALVIKQFKLDDLEEEILPVETDAAEIIEDEETKEESNSEIQEGGFFLGKTYTENYDTEILYKARK